MVRTYSFNPSTQASANSNLPCAKQSTNNNENFYVLDENEHHHHHEYTNNVTKLNNNDNKFAKSMTNLLAISAPFEYNDTNNAYSSLTSTSNFNRVKSSNVNPIYSNAIHESVRSLNPLIKSNFVKDLQESATIVEDATAILGIRCIRINGQRFYQPLSVESDQMNSNQNVQNFKNDLSNFQSLRNDNLLDDKAKLEVFSTALLNQE